MTKARSLSGKAFGYASPVLVCEVDQMISTITPLIFMDDSFSQDRRLCDLKIYYHEKFYSVITGTPAGIGN